MAFYNNVIAGAAGAGSGGDAAGFKVERSIRIDKPGTAYLSRTPASASNRRKWTWSGWVKQSNHDSDHHLFVGDTSTGSLSDTTFGRLYIEAGGAIRFSGYTTAYRTTNAVLRDCGAWYHIVCVVDTTLSTATDRIKIYLNGLRLTSFSTSNDPSQNAVLGWNQASVHTIGARSRNGTIAHHHDGYLAEVHFLDALAPGTATDDSSGTATGTPNAEYLTDFGQFDDAGFWRAKAFTGAHGPSLVNYHDNNQTDLNDGNVYLSTQPVENIFDGDDTTYSRINRGTNSNPRATFIWQPTGGISGVTKIRIKYDYCSRYQINNGTWANVNNNGGYQEIYNGSAFTLTTLKIQRTDASGSDFGIFVYGVEINDTLISNVNNNGFHLNFSDNSSTTALGSDAAGSNDWQTHNMSIGSAVTPSSNFDCIAYTGTGSTQNITGLGFQPDLVVVKSRSGDGPPWVDSVRGADIALFSSSSTTEGTYGSVTAFLSNGFTVGSYNNANQGSTNFIAWCWKAGGTASSNTDGTITSSVSANAAYGFSIVTYTGNGTSPSTIGHGLNSAPGLIFVKNRDSTNNWAVYHSGLVDGSTVKYLRLNTTDGEVTGSGHWQNTVPTNSVFYVGNDGQVNANGDDYVAYCFHDVSGYQKIGSYVGNGSSTGPVITTGFKPRFLLIKNATDSGNDWCIYDSVRDPANPRDTRITWNDADADTTHANIHIDFLNSGFQPKATGSSINTSGKTYVYWAIAEDTDPFENDSMIDTPTDYVADSGNNGGNYATIDANRRVYSNNGGVAQAGVYSIGALKTIGASWAFAVSTINIPPTGKWYWEIHSEGNNNMGIAAMPTLLDQTIRDSADSNAVWYAFDGKVWSRYTGQGSTTSVQTNLAGCGAGNVLGVAVDSDNSTVKFYVNGALQYTYALPTLIARALSRGEMFAMCDTYYGSDSAHFNFGQYPFKHSVPANHLTLCSTNIPDSAITDGTTAMDIVRWTGDGSGARTVSGLNLTNTPGLVWSKTRNHGYHNNLFDSVRGYGTSSSGLITDYNGSASGGTLNSATASSLTFSGGVWHNENARTYISWAWDGGNLATISTYNQSQTWSDNVTNPSGAYGAASNAFDGNLTTHASPNNSNPMTYTNPSASDTVISTFRINTDIYSTTGITLELNDTDIVSQVSTTAGWHTITGFNGQNFSKLKWAANPSNYEVRVRAVEVNGKILVDAGIIPAGGLNDSLYLQGDVYSGDLSTNDSLSNATNAFDGSVSTRAQTASAGTFKTLTWAPSPAVSFSQSFEIYCDQGNNIPTATWNGNTVNPGGGAWVTVFTGSGTIDSTYPLVITTNGATQYATLKAVRLDGKILVDQNATPASNVPDVACRVTANQTAGFSVVKVDNPTATQSRAHGLTKAPELILAKATAQLSENWHIFHSYYGKARYGIFTTNGFNTSDQWGTSEPDANQFFVKPATGSGANYANGMIYYIWHSVPGYSSIGAFTGNGNANGPGVATGFRPQWLLLKLGSANGQNWVIYDSERNPYNVAGKQLYPNLSTAEGNASSDTHARVDFLSNGFKLRGSHTSINTTGAVILYAAFASHPFKLSNAV